MIIIDKIALLIIIIVIFYWQDRKVHDYDTRTRTWLFAAIFCGGIIRNCQLSLKTFPKLFDNQSNSNVKEQFLDLPRTGRAEWKHSIVQVGWHRLISPLHWWKQNKTLFCRRWERHLTICSQKWVKLGLEQKITCGERWFWGYLVHFADIQISKMVVMWCLLLKCHYLPFWLEPCFWWYFREIIW